MSYTSDQLLDATKVYGSMGRKRVDTESYLKLILRWVPTVATTVLDEIERQLGVAPSQAVAVAVTEPVEESVEVAPAITPAPSEPTLIVSDDVEPAPSAEPDTEVTDEEIKQAASVAVNKADGDYKKALALLRANYELSDDEAKDFIGEALSAVIDDEKTYADKSARIAQEAVDKQNEAQAEANRIYVDHYCLKANKKKPTTPEEYEKYAKLLRAQLDKEDAEEAASDKDVEDRFPDCPVMPGVLSDLARALYPSLPYEFKYFSLVTHFGLLRSGIDTFGMEKHIQPRFYTVLVSTPNRGKTASINEARNAMKIVDGMVTMLTTDKQPRLCSTPDLLASADSGQFIADQFVQLAKDSKSDYDKGICLDLAAKALLDPDELSDVFEKARTSQGRVSTLFIELLKLHSGNRTGSGTKGDGKKKVENAHLAILAGTTTRKYPMLWTGTGGGADGLRSRFISITTNNPPVPPQPLQSDVAAVHKAYDRLARLAQMPGQSVQLSPEAGALLQQWWYSFDNGRDAATRVLEFVKQLLMVLAITNAPENHNSTTLTVGPELVEAATRFGDYVIAVREKLNPGDAWTHIQAMENSIIQWSKQHTTKATPGSMRDCRRVIHPERLPGGLGTFKMAWKNCIDTEMLKWVRKEGKSDKYSA
jgi:hypothetical protein